MTNHISEESRFVRWLFNDVVLTAEVIYGTPTFAVGKTERGI